MKQCDILRKNYYSCYPFLQQLSILFLNHAVTAPSKECQERMLDIALQLCNRIIGECKNVTICTNASAIRNMIYLQMGRGEDVIAMLESTVKEVNRIEDDEILLTMAYMSQGDLANASENSQIGLFKSISSLI